MDLYAATQGPILKRLLAKRQHPSSQFPPQNSVPPLKYFKPPSPFGDLQEKPQTLYKKDETDHIVEVTSQFQQESTTGDSDCSDGPEHEPRIEKRKQFASDADEFHAHHELKYQKLEHIEEEQPSQSPPRPRLRSSLSEFDSPDLCPLPFKFRTLKTSRFQPRRKVSEGVITTEENVNHQSPGWMTPEDIFATPKCPQVDAHAYAAKFSGVCLSRPNESGNTVIFKCVLNHRFTKHRDELGSSWCPTCESTMKSLQETLTANSGDRILDEFLCGKLELLCRNGHNWSADYKTVLKKECPTCQKISRDDQRKRMMEEARKKMLEDQIQQDKLLEEARQRMLEQARNAANKPDSENKSILAFQQFMNECELAATNSGIEYLNDETNPKIPLEQLVELYKFHLIPEELLTNYFKSLSDERMKSEYRRTAKVLHPDKNFHPLANATFLKLGVCYNRASNIPQ